MLLIDQDENTEINQNTRRTYAQNIQYGTLYQEKKTKTS